MLVNHDVSLPSKEGSCTGATGARIVTTVCNELQLTGEQYGLLTVCAAGGLGVAMVLERE